MSLIPSVLLNAVNGRLERMRFPTLFLIMAGLFVFDLFIPDFIPFVDEIVLAIATLMVGNLKRGKEDSEK